MYVRSVSGVVVNNVSSFRVIGEQYVEGNMPSFRLVSHNIAIRGRVSMDRVIAWHALGELPIWHSIRA